MSTYKCCKCRKPFTVKVGTVLESSYLALHLWLQAIFLLASSKKGISANQLHRTSGVALRTELFIAYRIREAMRACSLAAPMGSGAGFVETDENFIGRKKGTPKKRAFHVEEWNLVSFVGRELIFLNRKDHKSSPPISEP